VKNEVHQALNLKMEKTISVLIENLNHIRAGRANPKILDRLTVEYYGAETPLIQLASVSVPEPRILQIQPYDASILKDIEKAIQMSDLGLNPNNDGKLIRLIIPMLNEERRKDLTKEIKKYGEESKVAIRNERRDAIDKLKKMEKDNLITEDGLSSGEKEIQKMVDVFIEKVDQLISKKNDEIMEI